MWQRENLNSAAMSNTECKIADFSETGQTWRQYHF